MRSDEFPYLTDWLAISLRWLALVGAAAMLTITKTWILPETGVVAFLAAWNILMAVLAMLNRRLPGHRLLNVGIDFTACLALYFLTGGIHGPLIWVGVIVLFSSAVYFEWRGSLIMTVMLLVFQVGVIVFLEDINTILVPVWALSVMTLLLGVLIGILSRPLINNTRRLYYGRVQNRNQVVHKARYEERGRLQTFYEMIETLSGTLDYHNVLESALDLSLNALEVEGASAASVTGAFLLFGENSLQVGAARGFVSRDMQLMPPGEKGVLHDVIKTGEPQVIQNPLDDPELCQFITFQKSHSVLCLPLVRGLKSFGVQIFAHPDAGFFTNERRELLEMISHQAVIAIQNALLFQNLEDEKKRIIESQEEARKQLARELHDGPTQSVSAIAMQVSIARVMLQKSPDKVEEELSRIEDLARRTTQEIRQMLFTLRPLTLESSGLLPTLEALAEKMRDLYKQNVVIDVNEAIVDNLDADKQKVVFQIADEAVNNARKHARAKQIRVRLQYLPQDKRVALLEIIDNGVGFDVKAVTSSYEKRGSLGMVNLQERADLVSGLLRIDSVPGKGTRIRVYIPLDKTAADLLQRGKAGK